MSDGIFNRFTGYHNPQSIRLEKYDYSRPGYYFITICIHDRERNLFGEIVESIYGANIVGAGSKPAQLSGSDYNAADFKHRAGLEPAPTRTMGTAPTGTRNALPEIIRQFKTFSAKRINKIRNSLGIPVWQRNYYDHIIRNERSLYFIRKYIYENPLKWSIDSEKHLSIEEKETEKHFADAPVTQ